MRKTKKDKAIYFNFHGITVKIESQSSSLLDLVTHDFSTFKSSKSSKVHLCIRHTDANPSYQVSETSASFMTTPRNVSFRFSNFVLVDYFGRATLKCQSKMGPYELHTTDTNLAREIIYLTLLSRVSHLLELKGLHRIHALGISVNGRGSLVLLPSGGGKTSLAISLLENEKKTNKNPTLKLISEDSPFLNQKGQLLPFAIRMGILGKNVPKSIPKTFVKKLERMEFAPKTTIDATWYRSQLENSPVPVHSVFLGARRLPGKSEIIPAKKIEAIKHLVMNSVVGVGLYQGMEFIMQNSTREILKESKVLWSRVYSNFKALKQAKFYHFYLSRDPQENAQTLRTFLEHPPRAFIDKLK